MGVGEYGASQRKVFNKNENTLAWRDGKLDPAAPDLMAALHPKRCWMTRGDTMSADCVADDLP